VPVPRGVVEEIRAQEGPDGLVPIAEPAPFQPGEAVTVTGGTLRDQSGWFQRMADRERVVVLLDMLGRPMSFTLPLSAVARAA
jgi:transcription antitermination factor NusG